MSSRVTKKTVKNTICSKCSTLLEENQLFCYECGSATPILKNNLSMWQNLKSTWNEYYPWKGKNYLFTIFFFFLLLVPLGAIIYWTYDNYWLNNLILLVFLPLVFIPFSLNFTNYKEGVTIKEYFLQLKEYPRFFLFILVNVVYFLVLKYATMSVDPILNLVRLIMVLYWLTLMTPMPHYLVKKNRYPLMVLRKVIVASREVRWQLFYTYLLLTLLNIAGLALAGIGLLFTIPFSLAVLENYYNRMDSHNLF